MSKKDETKFSLLKFFTSKEEDEEEVDSSSVDNSFAGLARQLRVQQEEKAKKAQEISEEVGEYFVGVVINALHMTGTALGNRIHDMIMGDSHNSDNDPA